MSWPDVNISDVCELVVDCVNKTAPVVEYETPYKMLRTTNVRGGFVDVDNVRYVTEDTFEKWNRRATPQRGDVILTREAPLGDVGRLTSDDKVFLGQRLFLYRADQKKLDSLYLAYVLQSPLVQGRIKSKGFGATVQHAKVGDCENLLIPYPPLDIQRKIGSILSNYDDLIENNRRRIQLLEESARLLYQEWFVRLRFPGHEQAKIIDGVPEGWERTTADKVMNILSGGTPKTKMPEFWNGDIPFFTPKDAKGLFTHDTEKTITELGLSKCNSHLYPKYTVFITARGTVGKLSFAQRPMAMNQSCYALIAKDGISQEFLYSSLKASIDQFKARASGAVFDAIVVDTFKDIPFLIPGPALRDEFTKQVKLLFNQVDNLSIQNIKLAQARDLLLPKLMSGELAV